VDLKPLSDYNTIFKYADDTSLIVEDLSPSCSTSIPSLIGLILSSSNHFSTLVIVCIFYFHRNALSAAHDSSDIKVMITLLTIFKQPFSFSVQFKVALLMYGTWLTTVCALCISAKCWHQSVALPCVGNYAPPAAATTPYREQGPSSAIEHFQSLDQSSGTLSPSSSEQPTTFKHSNVYSKCTFLTFLIDLINSTVTVLLF